MDSSSASPVSNYDRRYDHHYYYNRDDVSSSKTNYYNTMIELKYQIEYWIQNEYPVLRDDIITGIIKPIGIFLFGFTIVAIILKIIKHYYFPPSPYELHIMAIQLLQSVPSSSSTSIEQKDTSSIQKKLKKLKLLSETSNTVVVQSLLTTTKKSKQQDGTKKKKLPSFKQYWVRYKNEIYNKIRLYSKGAGIYSLDYTNNISSANVDDSEYQAIYLLHKAAIQLQYIPARITLAAYYVYRSNQLDVAEQLLLPLQQLQKQQHKQQQQQQQYYDSIIIQDILYDIQIIRSSSSYDMALSMIQTILREDEYISIHYAQQYKYIWKQYILPDELQESTGSSKSNNNNSNNSSTKSKIC